MIRIGRRHFTAGLGASLLAGSLLDFLAGGEARAATPTARAKRLIVFFTPNGTVPRMWRPSGTGTGFTLAPGSILEPLARHNSQLLILDGIDFAGVSNHEAGMAAMLTGVVSGQGATGGMSVDQFVARQLGSTTRFQSLEFGVQTSAWGAQRQTRISYSAPGVFVSPEDSPANAFQRVFGSMGGGGSTADTLLKRRLSMLDLARQELKDLSTRVGTEEKHKLEQHLESFRQVERGLTGEGTTPTTSCTQPQAPLAMDYRANANFPAVGRAQMDLMVSALACGLTRVASLQWAHTVAPQVFSWLSASESHHELSHKGDSNTAGVAAFVKCERWFAEQFAYLLDALKARPDLEGGGSLLDTSLVLWAKELGDSRLHSCRSVPFLLAGGAGGYFRMGRSLQYTAAPHQKLLTSVCHAMGLPIEGFGDVSLSTGPLDGLV